MKAETGQESLTDAQWDLLVERQKNLLAGEEAAAVEEVKVEEVQDVASKESKSLYDVANVNWGYFSQENESNLKTKNAELKVVK